VYEHMSQRCKGERVGQGMKGIKEDKEMAEE
jgi:hypothetical protein